MPTRQHANSTIHRTEVLASVITFDAYEKAEELEILAEDRFERKKNDLLREDIRQLEEYYKEKEKKLLLDNATVIDKIYHQGKLEVQNTRKDCIDSIEDDIKEELKKLFRDRGKYKDVMRRMILQGLYMLLESEIHLVVKKKDKKIVDNMLENISKEYKEKTGIDLNLAADNDSLPEKILGGVVITALNKKIAINHTFENRIVEIIRIHRPLIQEYLAEIYKNE